MLKKVVAEQESAPAISASSNAEMEYLDIPAFLRRKDKEEVQ